METPDYQIALLLQKQLQHENSYHSDLHLARTLQNDFNMEISIENPTNLTLEKKNLNGVSGLTDPSWELVDPTPNIHNLFVVFNQRFFWNKLLAVCVSWSKTMTTCAGICSYQGRGGMCSIRLSEPLLKLRPRKDLVETLLHEMIHAYLFVTHNNRDRDGHGPEFHKHMYRINKEAGTNITVYHDFHDEVRLYQQHWWRCNGPCQNWKPYFGMVRRAINRAPGPNDRWWAEHFRTCGGSFVKVKEPEKKSKTQKQPKLSPKKSTATSDIRKFVSVTKQNDSNTAIHGLNNTSSIKTSTNVSQVSNVGNIHGFTKLQTPSHPVAKHDSNGNILGSRNNGNNSTRIKSNSNSTIVVNKKVPETNNKPAPQTKPEVIVFSGTGKTLSSSGTTSSNYNKDDYSVVRNHWQNKFPPKSPQKTKRNRELINEDEEKYKNKKIERSGSQHSDADFIALDDSFVTCPVCEKQIQESLLNNHLDSCLTQENKKSDEKHSCFICNKELSQEDYRKHVSSCFENNFHDNDNLVECEICNVMFDKSKIEAHRKLCVEEVFAGSSPVEDFSDRCVSVKTKVSNNLTQCQVCDNFIEADELDSHQDKCLLKVFDYIEKKHGLADSEEAVSCLVCNKKVCKRELNAHLDECMSGVFDVENDINLPSTSGSKAKQDDRHCNDEDKYNCPFCMKLYSELDMSGHLDECLISDDNNKSILIDSMSSDDQL